MEPKDLVRGTVRLVSLPDIFIKVNRMVDDPTSSASDIGKLISQDPTLTARLLKIANSPLYGFPSRIDTVSRSITVIGTRGLRDLILASQTIEMFSGFGNGFIDMYEFWRHSIYCGVLARILATKCNALHTEPFFVSGLLHDIGQLIILNKLPEMAKEAHLRSKDCAEPLFKLEDEIIGFNHAQVGGELLRMWKLPVNIRDAVAYHHAPGMATESPLGAAIVHMSTAIARKDDGVDISQADIYIDPLAWAITGLSEDIIVEIMQDARLQYQASLELFLPKAA